MRIGIDARELCGRVTGVGRHLSGLLQAWSLDPDAQQHQFFVYSPGAIAAPLPNATIRQLAGRGGTAWEQLTLPGAASTDRLDVFFAPAYTAPLTLRVPTVVLIHDVSFVAHPEWFRWKEGLRRRTITRWSGRRAALVLTVSDTARQEIIRHLSLPPGSVKRIYPGISAPAANTVGAREPMVLFAGSIFNRRHLPHLINAFAPIAATHAEARLVIVGDNRTYPYEDLSGIARRAGISSNVMVRSYVDDAELARLYGKARVFALLSEYEGFGHPPLEALSAGVPAILLDTPVAREVCGTAARYVTLDDTHNVTHAIEELLFGETERTRILAAARPVIERYSWDHAGRETLAALCGAAAGVQPA